jgi:guanyl-specific ribonuclease Sa
MGSRKRITLALAALVILVLGGWLLRDVGGPGGLPVRPLSSLPVEVTQTLDLIERGGPFPHPRDGMTFSNRERLLPQRDEGHYKEYTVPTPGSPDRGARRLVTGSPSELYYTDDHYETFVVVDTSQ